MTIYEVYVVVVEYDYGSGFVEGVFDSQFKANERKKELLKKDNKTKIEIERWKIE